MSSIFKAIGRFFKKLFAALKKILAVVLVVLAVIVIIWACIFCPPLGGALFGIAFASSGAALAFGCCLLVGAFLVDKDTASKVVGKVGEAAGDAAAAVGEATGNVVSGVINGLASSGLLLWLAVGAGAYFLLSSNGGTSERVVDSTSTQDLDVRRRNEEDKDGVVVATPDQLYGGVMYG